MNTLNLLNSAQSYLQKCDWDKVVNQITKYAHFDFAKKRISQSPIYHTIDELEENYENLSFFSEKILSQGAMLYDQSLGKIPSHYLVEEIHQRLQKSAWFSLSEVHQLVVSLEAWSELRNNLPSKWLITTDELNWSDDYIRVRRELLLPLREFIFADGMIQYHLHPILKPKFKSLTDCDEKSKKLFHHVMFHHPSKDKWQGSTTDIINNKYVILVKTDHFDHSLGSIVRRSESGLSLYVELKEFQELSQTRERIQAEIEHILHQIAWQFSQIAHKHHRFLMAAQNQILKVDELKAKAIRSIEGGWKRPTIASQAEIFLEGLRHPLIAHAVKNDIKILNEQKTIIISGPNTGGKTVILKSIVLAHLMLHHGLFLPVDDAVIYPFKNIIYLSGDDQDINQGLSSFASEMEIFGTMLSHLAENNLIIIDEILKSTSSEEASAIAWGILHRLQASPYTFTFLSTHHNSLKVFAHQSPIFVSAHMGFSGIEKKPTYQLHFGRPGSSYALEIAEHICKKFPSLWPALIIAQKQLEGQQLRYEQLLMNLTEEKRLADLQYTQRQLAVDEEWQKLKSQQESFKLKIHTEFEKTKQELKNIKIESVNWQNELKSIPTKVHVRKIDEKFQTVNQLLQDKEDTLVAEFPFLNAAKFNISSQHEIKQLEEQFFVKGNSYFSVTFNQKVTLIDLQGTEDNPIALIALGPMKTKVPLSDLMAKPYAERKKDFTFRLETTKEIKIEWDCRGMRLEEFEHLIQDLCGHIMAKSIPYAEIIHGHGNGVLKQSIRQYLKNHTDLVPIIDPLKSDGVTTIKLRDSHITLKGK